MSRWDSKERVVGFTDITDKVRTPRGNTNDECCCAIWDLSETNWWTDGDITGGSQGVCGAQATLAKGLIYMSFIVWSNTHMVSCTMEGCEPLDNEHHHMLCEFTHTIKKENTVFVFFK